MKVVSNDGVVFAKVISKEGWSLLRWSSSNDLKVAFSRWSVMDRWSL